MNHAGNRHRPAGILALALAIAIIATPGPATARTFNFNSAGSMVQLPLPPQRGCVIRRALSRDSRTVHCQKTSVL
jgi:hypothetical protein